MQSEMMNRPMFRSPQGAPQGGPPMPPAGGLPMQKNPEAGIAALTQGLQSQTKAGLASAANPEEAINAMRGNRLPLQARYAELAQIVGPEDAQATPPMVLTLVQPALMLGEGGSGIEGLMPGVAGEPPAPGGIGELMPQARPAPQMAPSPQEFSRGGYVRGYQDGGGVVNAAALRRASGLSGGFPMSGGYPTSAPSGQGFQRGAPQAAPQQQQASPFVAPSRAGSAANLQQYYDEEYSAYMDILAPTEEEKKASKRDLWFDVARRGLAMAAGTNPDTGAQVKGNTASRFADAFGTLPTTISANRREMETGAQNRARQAAAQSASSRLAGERQAAYEAALKGSTRAPALYEVRDPSGKIVFTGNYEDPIDQAKFGQYKGLPNYTLNEVGEFDAVSANTARGSLLVVDATNQQVGPTFPDTPEGLVAANAFRNTLGEPTSIQKTGTYDTSYDPETARAAAAGGGSFEEKSVQMPDGTVRLYNIRDVAQLRQYEIAIASPGAMEMNRPLNASEASQQLNSPAFIGYLAELSMDNPQPFTPTELSTLNSLIEKATAEVTDTSVGADGLPVTSSRTPRLSPQWDQAIISAANKGIAITVPPYLMDQVANPGNPLPPGDLSQGNTAVANMLNNAGKYELFGTAAAVDRFANIILPAIFFGAFGAGSTEEASVERGLQQWHESIVQSLTASTPGRDAEQTLAIFRKFLPTPNAVLTSKTDAIGAYIGLKAAMTDDITRAKSKLLTAGGLSRAAAETAREGISMAEANMRAVDVMIKQLQAPPSAGVPEADIQEIMRQHSRAPNI